VIWLVPLLGLFVSSFRERADIAQSGWWTVFPHQAYISVDQIQLTRGIPLDPPVQVGKLTLSDTQLRAGFVAPDGLRYIWANRRARLVDVQQQQWMANMYLTAKNYSNVLLGQTYTYTQSDGSTKSEKGEDMSRAFINSLTVTIPATVIPILLAAFAAYAFAWMRFPGRRPLFAMVVGLLPCNYVQCRLLRVVAGSPVDRNAPIDRLQLRYAPCSITGAGMVFLDGSGHGGYNNEVSVRMARILAI
jgi:alpha-glucoside transport system permease protein